MLVVSPGGSTFDVCDGVGASSVLAVTVREAARDISNISSVPRCRAVRLVPEAVARCDANPEDMVGVIITFFGGEGCPI